MVSCGREQLVCDGSCVDVHVVLVPCAGVGNVLVGVLATLAITCNVASIVGTISAMGWTLSAVESVCVIILVGFSVDYVVGCCCDSGGCCCCCDSCCCCCEV